MYCTSSINLPNPVFSLNVIHVLIDFPFSCSQVETTPEIPFSLYEKYKATDPIFL